MRADPKAEIETNNIPPTAMTPYAIIDISCRFQMIKAIWMISWTSLQAYLQSVERR